MIFGTILSVIPVLIWTHLLTGRGGFWRVSKHFAPKPDSSFQSKYIVAVIPARNEADVIGRTIHSLLQQRNLPQFHIVLVDDHSSDNTAGAAWSAARELGALHRLTVLQSEPLSPNWTGKLWAVAQGVACAETLNPDFLLLTDADIAHGPTSVGELLSLAERERLDLVSYMVKLATVTLAEQMLIPAFVFFFFMLYPPAWTYSRRRKTAGAAGGCMLIRLGMLKRIGGVQTISNRIIDDCALAKAVKNHGGRIWLGLTHSAESVRSYGGFTQVGHMIARTAFNQLHHSALLLLGTLLGLFFTYLLPPVLIFSGRPLCVALGALAWLLMSIAYLPMVRFYKQRVLWSVTLPAIALFYMGATFYSAIQYWRKQGGEWKGRIQDTA